ncbi:MAG: histidine phosphatase family protein [Actinobacteria bacterium]|nr:MAG: histidine phosphatase family protein [Actinomycetota bacterium]
MEHALLTRHAESEASVAGLTNGDPRREIGLTALGSEQARRLGEQLANAQIELCAVSEFRRAQETADIALAGREVPRLVLPGLNDIRFGEFEGQPLSDYRRWARAHGPEDVVPGGDSRAATVRRYAEAFRALLARPDRTILVVAHSLPIRYALDAAAGTLPAPAVEQVPYAEPFELDANQLSRAVDVLERWVSAPTWR